MRGSNHTSLSLNGFRVAPTNWHLNGMRQHCVPEAERSSLYAFVVGLPFGFCVSVKKHTLVSRYSHCIYAKQYDQWMTVEAVLCDIDDVEHIEETRHEAYMMKSVKCETTCGAFTSARVSRIDWDTWESGPTMS